MKITRRNWLEVAVAAVVVAAVYGTKRLADIVKRAKRRESMAHLKKDKVTGHLLKHPTSGHLIKGCPSGGIACADCQGDGPITVTITTTGSCDEVSEGCDYDCAGDVIYAAWVVGSWLAASSMPGPSTGWLITIKCVDDVWTMDLEGGCGDMSSVHDAKWEGIVFEPTGCEKDGDKGYPTHAGVNMGNPTTNGDCWIDCVPTVALS